MDQGGRASAACLAAALAAVVCAAPAQAGPPQGVQPTLRVSAVIPQRASIRVAPPAWLTLSEEDIARGFVQVTAPVEVAVESNMPKGYALMFALQGEQVRQAQVLGPDGTLRVDGAGAVASRAAPAHGLWRETLSLRIRFELADAARPGQYAWPLDIVLIPQ